MQKASCLIIFMLTVVTASAVIVDDFETYPVGAIPSPWVVTTAPATVVQDGANQCLQGYGCYRPLGSVSISDSSTEATFFFRVYKPSGYTQDCSAGLSHLAAPGGDWNELEAYISIVGNDLRGRDNGANISLMTISNNTWYSVWLVLNNSANTYNIYVNTGAQDATLADKKTTVPFGFRNDGGDLVSFKVYGRSANGPIKLDDLAVVTGTDLSIPVETALPAVLLEGPADAAAHENESAQFAVSFTSETQPSISWYKAGAPATLMDPAQSGVDVELTYDQIDQAYRSTLLLSDLTLSDDAHYYCMINNESGFAVNSGSGMLKVYGLVAHWTLDESDYLAGQYLDIAGAHHAAATGTPEFVDGADGAGRHAVQITPASGWAQVEAFNPSTTGQLSVSQWVKWQQTPQTSDDLIASTEAGGAVTAADGLTSSERWQHVSMVFDGTMGKLYINSVLQAQGPFALPADMTALLQIGSSENGAEYFNGSLDDLRIYNYALTDAQVLAVYDEMAGGCGLSFDLSGPAGSPDCVVDLYDLVVFAGDWLSLYDYADFLGLSSTWLLNGL